MFLFRFTLCERSDERNIDYFHLLRESNDLNFVLCEIFQSRAQEHRKNLSEHDRSCDFISRQANVVRRFRETNEKVSITKDTSDGVQKILEFFLVVVCETYLEPIIFRK